MKIGRIKNFKWKANRIVPFLYLSLNYYDRKLETIKNFDVRRQYF